MSDDQPNRDWKWYHYGIDGMVIMFILCGLKVLDKLQLFFTAPWTWTELALFPLQVAVIGFATGAITGLMLPLSRYGTFGHIAIGAISGATYFLVCTILFMPELQRDVGMGAVVIMMFPGAIIGAGLGWWVGRDETKPQ